MQRTSLYHYRLSAAVAAMAVLVPAYAPALAGNDNSDIIVTAKSRAESLQDVPLSITALNTDDLRSSQVRSVSDLQAVTSNLSILTGSGRNEPTAWSVRGLASNTSDERFQGISFFIDGVALSGQLASLDMENVERVEVIKGPQSASFGRATYSGAINFITKEPTDNNLTGTFRARGSYTKGSNEPTYYLNGSLSAPIVDDHLWISVSATTLRNGKLGNAIDSGQAFGREQSDIVSGTLFWKPDPTLSIRLRGQYSFDEDAVPIQTFQGPRDWVEAGVPLVDLPRGRGSFLPGVVPDPDFSYLADKGMKGTKRDRYFGSLVVKKEFGDYELAYRGGFFSSREYRNVPSYTRSAVPGQDPVYGDLIGLNPPVLTLGSVLNSASTGREHFLNTSHQLELLSPGADAFRWRAGLYYFYEKNKFELEVYKRPTNQWGRVSMQSTTNLAGFGGLDWDVSDSLTLSAEGRVQREEIAYPICSWCGIPNLTEGKEAEVNFTPRLTVTYKLAPSNMVYALYSNGLKSARFSNTTPPGQPQTLLYAKPERLDNFEIGTKNSFFENRVIFNLTGFYNRVRNQQLTSSTPYVVNGGTSYLTATNNVGESEIWGFELETRVKVTPEFTLTGSLGHAAQKFVNDDPVILAAGSSVGFPVTPDGSIIMKGKTQGNVPAWNGYVAAEYTVPVSDGDLSLRVDSSYRGKFYADLANLSEIRSSWTMNSRLAWSNEKWDLGLYGKNLLNNRRAMGAGFAGGTTTCGFTELNTAFYGSNQQCLNVVPQRPREIGIEFGLRF